jgi:hypothetical protein
MSTTTMAHFGQVSADPRQNRDTWFRVRIETRLARYEGMLHARNGRRSVCRAARSDPFIKLVDVSMNGDRTRLEPFIAINKKVVLSVRILDGRRIVSFNRDH